MNKNLMKEILNRQLDLRLGIKTGKIPSEFENTSYGVLDKDTLLTITTQLKEVQKRSEYMSSQFGVDLLGFEGEYINIIGTLLSTLYNPLQLKVLEYFTYDVPYIEKWDGKIRLKIGDKKKSFDISTPDKLWEVVEKLKQ
jgi:hypothetical protein